MSIARYLSRQVICGAFCSGFRRPHREGSRFASNIFAKNQDTDMMIVGLSLMALGMAMWLFIAWRAS